MSADTLTAFAAFCDSAAYKRALDDAAIPPVTEIVVSPAVWAQLNPGTRLYVQQSIRLPVPKKIPVHRQSKHAYPKRKTNGS